MKGRVQGVSFRSSLHERATRDRVEGWVRNTLDGSVEAILQGDEENVRRVIEWARRGPPLASVLALTEESLDRYPHQVGFKIVS